MAEFRHVARCAGLRPETRKSHYHFVGRGRRWRVNNQGQFQMGDADFDRWANSVAISVPAPKTKRAVIAAVREMLAATPTPKDSDK